MYCADTLVGVFGPERSIDRRAFSSFQRFNFLVRGLFLTKTLFSRDLLSV
jgi:hypothetical protein